MKKLIYTIALVVMGVTASYAQKQERQHKPEGTPEQRAERQATELQTKLGLTADQKAKVQAIELERIKKSEEWRKKDDADRKGTMDERKAFMKASKDKMDAVLTPEQKTKFEAAKKEMMGKRGDRNRGPRGEKTPPPPAPAKN